MGQISTTIHTIRHGQTEYNIEKRYAGTLEVSLNQAGRQSCRQASRGLAGMHFDAVITSALKRTAETARILLGDDVQLVQSELCNERDYGGMQGFTADEVEFLEPPVHYIKVGGDYHSLNPPGGESFEELRDRAERFLSFTLNGFSGLHVLVVSHGTFLQQFHGVLRGQTWHQALARAVPSLALTSFELSNRSLVHETSMFLLHYDQSTW